MHPLAGSALWMLLTKMRTGVTHQYQYYSAGKPLGARSDAVGYNPDSYPKRGVPKGKVTGKLTIVSKIYDGMKSDSWSTPHPASTPPSPHPSWSGRMARVSSANSPARASSPLPRT